MKKQVLTNKLKMKMDNQNKQERFAHKRVRMNKHKHKENIFKMNIENSTDGLLFTGDASESLHPVNAIQTKNIASCLQQTYGNTFLQRVIQAKLKSGKPKDIYEQEADRIADETTRKVKSMGPEESEISWEIENTLFQQQTRNCDEKLHYQYEDLEDEKKTLKGNGQKKWNPEITPGLNIDQNALGGNSHPIPNILRNFFKRKFGYEFSHTRLHFGTEASKSAKSLNAKAYTIGHDIVLDEGKFNSHTTEGFHLITHELVHEMQQNFGRAPLTLLQKKADEESAEDPQSYFNSFLGAPPYNPSIRVDEREDLKKIYLYLKKIRLQFPEKEIIVKETLNEYFPGQVDKIWEASKGTFVGYVGAAFGGRAEKSLKKAEKMGLMVHPSKMWEEKLQGSEVLIFSAHHYAAFPRLGGPGAFKYDVKRKERDITKKLNIKKELGERTAPRMKLIIMRSCSAINERALNLWKEKFPNAYVLGYETTSILGRNYNIDIFLNELKQSFPEGILLEHVDHMEKILGIWITFVKKWLENEDKRYTGEKLSKHRKRIIGWAAPDGRKRLVKFIKRTKSWEVVEE